MTMRELEEELRAALSTLSASVRPNSTTQASNFSFCSRFSVAPLLLTVWMPNCLKQSRSTAQVGSSSPASSTRATILLGTKFAEEGEIGGATTLAIGY